MRFAWASRILWRFADGSVCEEWPISSHTFGRRPGKAMPLENGIFICGKYQGYHSLQMAAFCVD
jgi:hypothetical protein